MSSAVDAPLDLDAHPGFYLRKMQQWAVAVFMQECRDFDITPVQYATLSAAHHNPGMDQRRLAEHISLDTSTMATVLDRLEKRRCIERRPTPHDRRAKSIFLTDTGMQLLQAAHPSVQRAQARMLERLSPDERTIFLQLARKMVDLSEQLPR
jgi:DNA-binding MarR family transcriptional regulator